ncbi:ArsR family transcriptional regulator [Aliidongia dinghuensis]|uniref:ArsR family transcriptional regulator n=1 Tax=Aliidongia dinghuensis TaxID=1867774 RepID=A0A8J2YUK5_9PROT|nr:metalloregulator ArsR/SmtB family transcription factor [Aliidongia dinghuensis]GGF17133.1 ArsR family transcriptional regulator [Aliidongia dinghuensis]
MDELLTGLRAVAEPTRLRLLALCSENELTVTELTTILGQSQPRVSRHLKLLCEGGLLERFREGNWVFYRLARHGGRGLAERLASLLPADDPTILRDRERLEEIERERERAASAYFAQNAHRWDAIRSLHVDERDVEAALDRCLEGRTVRDLLDVGTGTGRMLELFASRVERAVGLDLSRDMLAVARVNLERAMLRNCTVRHGDMYALPFTVPSFDLVILHQVLHFAERPAEAVAEAARVLRPGGRLFIVDFAPHQLETLREEHAHRRLGFADAEVREWSAKAGLMPLAPVHLPGEPLTVAIWPAERPAAAVGRALGDAVVPVQRILGEAHP